MAEEPRGLETIYSAALRKASGQDRSSYLDEVCGDDHALRARVEALLDASQEVGDFLEVPAGDADVTFNDSSPVEGPGTKIGRYELLELIGEGGMGMVYLAQQKEPVKRRVALKIIKPGMDSREVIARFEAERQALALLDHHNIAHVFDAGTTDTGRPYFVMEYVKGMSITRYCDEHRLDVEQRLRLFREVCEGVHHAHQKGIIHRDIKPSNILISMHEDRAVPKIIDFGIAKAAASTLTEKTMFTFHGQVLGTPEYMSPEQVDLATQDIDTRSDIYSLGVVLYELLAGVLPFDRESLHKIGLPELQRTLREVEPASPSIRLTNLGDEAQAIAHKRMTQVVPLARRLHRELEWIPLKAMRKDRCRRYKSASDMADDIQSYLNGNPLLAGPETAMYRVQKFVHKHAGSVATAALVSLAVIIGLVVSIAFGQRAEQARQQEAAARVEAEQARDKETALRKQLEQALARAEEAERKAEERAEAYRRAMYSNNLAMAKDAIDEASITRAKKLLDSCEEELRGWEWQRLNYIVDESTMTFSGHSDEINSIAVSTDGRRIASASDDKTVKIWDTATGSEVMTLRGHNASVYCAAFSPNGKHVASGGRDRVIKIWDAASGAEVMTVGGHEGWVGPIAYSPDGARIASGGQDEAIRVWDATSGAEVMTLRGHRDDIWGVAFSPDGRLIVSGSDDKTIKLWDATTGAETRTLRGHDAEVYSVAFSPNGDRIASASADKTVKIWDANTGDEQMTLSGHREEVESVMFSPDGKEVVSASDDRTIKVWDGRTGEALITLRGHEREIYSIVFSPDGKRLFSASVDNMIKAWSPAVDRDILRLHGVYSGDNQVAFSPDARYVAASVGNNMIMGGAIKLWDTASGAEIISLRGHRGNIRSIAFSPDGRQIVSGSQDARLKIWNVTSGALETTLDGLTDRFWAVSFSPDGRHIVSGGEDETVKIWNANTGGVEMSMTGHRGTIYEVTFSPDNRRVVSAGQDGTVRVWDAASGAELLTLRGHKGYVYDVSVSPDGKRIASCAKDKTVRLWDAATGDALMTLRGHESSVHTVFFDPDGTRIVSADYNREIKIWDAGTGGELMTLYGDSSYIMSAAFSPDGKSICVGGYDGITLLESGVPSAGHEPRQAANSAEEVVDELYQIHESYEEVISKLRDEDLTDKPLSTVALQIANARLWEDGARLQRQIWNVVTSPDQNEATYREALEKAEKAALLEPDNFRCIGLLGAAQYRTGAYANALETLTRAETLRADAKPYPTVSGWTGWRAMAAHQLGRDEEASTALRQLRSGFDEWFSFGGGRFMPFLKLVVEVEKLFAGGDNTLLSIWELIEENRLDEASELIEKARQSKSADYVSRMEGAIRLIEALRTLE